MKDELRLEIPNGYITFRVKYFLAHARRSAIRKFFKMLRGSEYRDEWRPEIAAWLKEQETQMREYRKVLEKEYVREKDRLAFLQIQYEQMKSSCYAAYTRNKEKLKAAREEISASGARSRSILAEMKKMKRQEERYREILEDASRILEEVLN